MNLSDEDKGVLLLAARESILSLFNTSYSPKLEINSYPALQQKAGTFVTLLLNNELRGCIGYLFSEKILFDTVCEAAQQAAVNDPRFAPVTANEVDKLNIEISVLSAPEPVTNYNEIELGRHGLILDEGYNRGVLLPQVAPENNYTLPQFLSALCMKAGLESNAWETKMLNIQKFSATVFSELGKRKRTYETQ